MRRPPQSPELKQSDEKHPLFRRFVYVWLYHRCTAVFCHTLKSEISTSYVSPFGT